MAEGSKLINLKVLSPSTEVEGGINLPELPASTTIKELRQKIQDAAPTRPATERMRLIYRGRVVINDNDTLGDVFGSDNIRESKNQSLHLVLRELPSTSSTPSPAPRSSTAPPNPFRPTQSPTPTSPLQTNPFRTLQQPQPQPQPQPPQPRPNSQPQIPQPHHHHHPHAHPHHHHLPQPLNPFGGPIPLPPHLQQQFAQAMAQNAQQNQMQPPAQTQPNEGAPASGDGSSAQQPASAPAPGPGLPNLPPNTTRTIRQEGIGPNGQRWTVTWNNTNVTIPMHANQQPILPRPFPHPPGFGVPARRTPSPALGNVPDQMLARVRGSMDSARQELENVRVLIQPPGGQAASVGAIAAANPPVWRIDQIRHAVRNLVMGLDNVDRGLAALVADPLMAQNRDFVSLQQSAAELRGQAEDFNRMLDRLQGSDSDVSTAQATPSSSAPSTSSTNAQTATTATQQPQSNTQNSSSDVPTELFILSSPQGPVGILFDQRGTYTTAPMVPTLPFQTFTNQFSANRQLIAGIGQQIAHNSTHLHNQLPAAQQAQNQQAAAGAQPVPDEVQNQNQDQNQPALPPAENDRLGPIAGHLWLIFKLACFIYFFAGGGGWYRPVMMGIIAAVVYLAQIGIFDTQFNMVRHHFEALLPLADRAARNGNHPDANGQAQPARPEPDRNLSPEEAARRLVQQRQDQRFGWIRESMRTTERAFAIFVASLWPGIGERMVQAQEERVRAERQAEEERIAREEAQRQEEEQKQQEQEAKDEVKAEEGGPSEELSTSSKGKERAETIEEGSASAS